MSNKLRQEIGSPLSGPTEISRSHVAHERSHLPALTWYELRMASAIRLCKFGLFLLSIAFVSSLQAGEFNKPWKSPSTALVIDPFSKNEIDWDKLKGESRLVGIIHKATVGTVSLDPKYIERKAEARKRGYLWGSYHWGMPGDPDRQADFYIDTVKPADDEVMALDLEDVTSKKFMSIDEAAKFVARVKERTSRYPLVYMNHRSAVLISRSPLRAAFTNVLLWYARFRPDIPDFPKGAWTTYVLWQFSSEIRVQYRIPGTRSDMDVNVFNGSVDELKRAWPFTRK